MTVRGSVNLCGCIGRVVVCRNIQAEGAAGRTRLSYSVRLTKVGTPPDGKTVAVWLTYVDAAGALQRVRVLNPDNTGIATNTPVTGTFSAPAGAQKIVKLQLAKENYGEFHADDVVLWAEGVTVNPTPQIASLSAASRAYGTSLTINGANFGATQGSVVIGGVRFLVGYGCCRECGRADSRRARRCDGGTGGEQPLAALPGLFY
ncbi:MAG: hypothetical protein C0394_04020 [Syntrophus sp. (in: bacteria)]|nr:hypothetical protein [Syntrophus sp. (in: bacteria)]